MEMVKPSMLIVAALTSAAVAWVVIGRYYGLIPRFSWIAPATLMILALIEAVAAHQTRAWIGRKPGSSPLSPLLIARYVALAKASSFAGAIVGGLYTGLAVWLLMQYDVLRAAAEDVPPVIGGVVASFILMTVAIVLERSCRVPPSNENTDSNHY